MFCQGLFIYVIFLMIINLVNSDYFVNTMTCPKVCIFKETKFMYMKRIISLLYSTITHTTCCLKVSKDVPPSTDCHCTARVAFAVICVLI